MKVYREFGISDRNIQRIHSSNENFGHWGDIRKELEKKGHKVKIIARRHAQTIDLLDLYGLKNK